MQKTSERKLSIVIPVYNESQTIKEIVAKVVQVALPYGWQKEIIVVDDGSTDGTRDILSNLNKDIRVILREENGGKGAALKDGFKAVTGDYVLIQDADAEYNPSEYPTLLQPIIEGKSEVVFGSRTLSKNLVPLNRIYFYGGLLVTRIFNFLFRTKLTDLATCYKVFPKACAEKMIAMPSDDFVFDVVEISHYLLRMGMMIVEVPITYDSRSKSKGKKLNWRHGMHCMNRIMALWGFEKFVQVSSNLSHWWKTATVFVGQKGYRSIFLSFCSFFLVFFLLYFSVSTLSSSDDHFFHFRFVEQMRQNGFFQSFWNFKAIYFSNMAQGDHYFVYYNFLFFLLAAPFAFITPLFLGIKLYAVFAVAGAFTLLYWCLKKLEIKNPYIWTLVFFAITSTASMWRFFLSRPYALAPSLLLLLLVFLYRKNYIGVFLVSFAYLFWHSSTFFMPPIVVIAYFVIEKFYGSKGDYKNLYAGLGGFVLSIGATYLVSSGFLLFIKETVFSIYWETIIGQKVNIGEGGELYPIDFFNFIQGNALMFSAFVMAIVVDVYTYIAYRFKHLQTEDYFASVPIARRTLHTTVLILTAVFFLGTVVASARFGDYFTFFAGLYVALSFDYMRRYLTVSVVKSIRRGLLIGCCIVLMYLCAGNLLFLQQRLAHGAHADELYQVGTWLNQNAQKGDIVFEANWSWFPGLFYYSPNTYYIAGLEPRFMYSYSPSLYWLWIHMSQDGYVCDQQECPVLTSTRTVAFKTATSTKQWTHDQGDAIATVISKQFHAKYIVSSRDYFVFNYILDNNPHFKKVLYDSQYNYLLYQVL